MGLEVMKADTAFLPRSIPAFGQNKMHLKQMIIPAVMRDGARLASARDTRVLT